MEAGWVFSSLFLGGKGCLRDGLGRSSSSFGRCPKKMGVLNFSIFSKQHVAMVFFEEKTFRKKLLPCQLSDEAWKITLNCEMVPFWGTCQISRGVYFGSMSKTGDNSEFPPEFDEPRLE